MPRLLLFTTLLLWVFAAFGQDSSIVVRVVDTQQVALPRASVELLQTDSSLLKILLTDSSGKVEFSGFNSPPYLIRASLVGYTSSVVINQGNKQTITLHSAAVALEVVTVSARKAFIELKPDKMVINLDAGITNTGTTVLETLIKLPGIAVDRDGNISLKGRNGVLVLVDGKPTYLNGSELINLLNSMNASQIAQVEIMDNPPAGYDAAGNAGAIDIRFKKGVQQGLNGTLTTSYGQGQYPKSRNNVVLNYHAGRTNLFLNHSTNYNRDFSDAYAFRTYYKDDGTVAKLLEQHILSQGKYLTHNLRTGVDYALSNATSLGLTLWGVMTNQKTAGNNPAVWMKPNRQIDSTIATQTNTNTDWRNGGASLGFQHRFSSASEWSADVDLLHYRISANQLVENEASSYSEAYWANTPTEINILSAKTDYTRHFGAVTLQTGWKTSVIRTDNLSQFEHRNGSGAWEDDLGKSNHFLYKENINALYGTAEARQQKWWWQGGLRVEATSYHANQLGNTVVKDSSFSRQYTSAFPSLAASFEKDSNNTFSLSAGRRIDRPAFQKLNPFVTIYNKYTYQRGNPYYLPQYTWNAELSHSYKNKLITSLRYSTTSDYFSQIFITDSSTGLVLFTEGNLRRMRNLGASVTLQLAPAQAWSFSLQAFVNRKKLEGEIEGRSLRANITQYSINLSNQFHFKKGWSGELTGVYNSASQQDIQEVIDPSGTVTAGLAKSVAQNRGTFRLSVRDIFYTTWVKGFTQFFRANEAFKIMSDTRYVSLSFTWRFGKAFKTAKHSEGAAGDEIQRVEEVQ